MGEKNLWSKLGLIVLLVGVSIWQIFPMKKDTSWRDRLKAGIDLAGGASLLFEIDDSGLQPAEKANLAERVATILKERVDPQGNRNLVWRPIGRNRLEIQMPRPPAAQKEHREALEKARSAILATNITEAQIRAALGMPPEQRKQAFAEMSRVVKSRQPLFDRLAAADEKYTQLTTTQPSTQPASTRPASTQPADVAQEADRAISERNQLIDDLLKTNLDPRVLGDVLELGKTTDARKDSLRKLKEAHPDLTALIDQMTESHDAFSGEKGALDDTSDLLRLLRGAGVLEYRILAQRSSSNPEMTDSSKPKYNEPIAKYVDQLSKYGPRPRPGDNYRWFKITKAEESKGFPDPPYVVKEYMGSKYVLSHSTQDMGLVKGDSWTLRSAGQGRDQMGRIAVNFSLSSHGKFGRLTGDNIGRPLSIFLDEEAISAATIQSQINDHGEITGSFTPEYVNYVVNTLEAGALPARLKEVPLQEKSVGPSLGETNRRMGTRAIMISFLLTIAFMAVYYTYNGFIADIALLMNLVITLGVMSFLQATFTLPGIAGLILTLGMAVDANVLIYERMREELQRGVSARMAVKLGYEKAFSAIFDSNLTTILTAAILAWIGSEEIKGFGLTLGIGLCISMFTALFVTRQYYNIMVPTILNQQETRRAWWGTGILAIVGGTFLALGWLFNSADQRPDSNLIGLGKFVLILFGTAALLMLSLWAFRLAYRASGHQKANRLPMMKLMSAPSIDWMGKYRIFWAISCVTITAGFILMWIGLKDKKLMDIEFVGGTSVQVQLKDEHKDLTDEKFLAYITGPRPDKGVDAAGWLRNAAKQLDSASVTSLGEARYVISTPEKLTTAQLQALLTPKFEDFVSRGAFTPAEGGAAVQLDPEKARTALPDTAAVQRKVKDAAGYARDAAERLGGARTQSVVEETASGETRKAFEIITAETRRPVVSEALLASIGDLLQAKQPIDAHLVKDADRAPEGIFEIKQEDNVLADVTGGNSQEPVGIFKGGAVLVFDDLKPPQTTGEVSQRLREMRLQPEFEGISWRSFKVVGLEPASTIVGSAGNPLFKKVAIVVNDPNIPSFDSKDTWRTEVAEKELSLAQAALASTQPLQRVTQFAPQVASEAAQKAIIAVILSLIAIAAYLWVRFGSAEFGLAGILALYHDVAVALACVIACHYVYKTPIGKFLGLQDFKIDLNIIAALLTIIGYSINDSIVIFDRIRENRGRLATVSPKLINDSINQTLSRTILTVFTVFIVVVVMYIWGGAGIKGFAFTMIIGCITGTYSTFAIATPMVHHTKVMWVVTIIITALTAAGVVLMAVPNLVAQLILLGTIAALTAVALMKFLAAGSAGAAPRPAAKMGAFPVRQ